MPAATSPEREPYRVLDQPHSTRSKWRILCIGAGASGLYLAYACEKRLKDYELVIYEKNSDIGGTWLENRYPGCACDIPSHIYTYSFRPNPRYSKYYAESTEIFEYFKAFEKEYELGRYIQFESKVIAAEWKELEGIYEVKIRQPNGEIKVDWCNTLINCSGILNEWKWPKVPGLKSFKGSLLHSAHWDQEADYVGKKVGLIGIGSSGIQITPKVQKVASSLEVFIRSPVWITPQLGGLGSEADSATPDNPHITNLLVRGQEPYDYSEEEKDKFEKDPEMLLTFRRSLELGICDSMDFCKLGSEQQVALFKICKENMERTLAGHPELIEKLIPKFAVGCRRPTPGAGFMEALVSDNVKAVFSPIQEVVERGIKTKDGNVHEFDVIICATGFDVGFVPFFELKGQKGVTMDESWGQEPNSYLGIAAPGFPNYYTPLGPRGPWANGSVLIAMERNLDNFISLIEKMQCEDIKYMMPKQRAVDDFAAHAAEWHKDTVWTEPCNSWYKRGGPNGKPYIWCGSIPSFMKTMSKIRWEDWEYEYKHANRFAYLGNGKVKADSFVRTERLKHLVPYVRNAETPWEIE